MDNTFSVQIYTPQALFFSEKATLLTVLGLDGEYGLMKNHTPCVIALKEGCIAVTNGDGKRVFSSGGGYLEMDGERARIFVSSCEKD